MKEEELNIEQMLEQEYRHLMKRVVDDSFAAAESEIEAYLLPEEKVAARASIDSIKAVLVERKYASGIQDHKRTIIRELSRRGGRIGGAL